MIQAENKNRQKITIGSHFTPFTNETLTRSYLCHVYKIYSVLLSSIAVDTALIISLLEKALVAHFTLDLFPLEVMFSGFIRN